MPEAPKLRDVFSIPLQNSDAMYLGDTSSQNSTTNKSALPKDATSNASVPAQTIDQSAESLLCGKINELTLEERTQAIHELHGVADIEEETAEMLGKKLRKVTQVAESFGDTDKTAAYRIALKMDKAYVNDKIRLMCLRADYYDSEKAAARMISFFSFKRQLFGDDLLTRDIVHDDLDGETVEALACGALQILQQRDRAGRGITMLVGNITHSYNIKAVSRLFYYVYMVALRDEEIQKKGIVVIVYCIGQSKFVGDRASKLADIWYIFPVRLVAMHMCYDHDALDILVSMTSQAMEGHQLCRFRAHKGSNLDCIFNLMTFGIPKEAWPFDDDTGKLNLSAHHKVLEIVRAKERSQLKDNNNLTLEDSPPEGKEVVAPAPLDIVVGLGRQSISSMGYMKFRDLLQDHREAYENASRLEKTVICKLLYRKLLDRGHRFVRATTDGALVECNDVEARGKISHTFRNMRQQKTERKGRQSGTTKREIS